MTCSNLRVQSSGSSGAAASGRGCIASTPFILESASSTLYVWSDVNMILIISVDIRGVKIT